MEKIDVNGIGIAYEIIGSGTKAIAITPGGRFSKDTPGIRELAESLAKSGYKTLIWDRVNCGESDISFAAETESLLNADTLAGLLKALDFGPALLTGGSAGARVSLLTAIRHPETVSGMFLFWITGGAVGLASLVMAYCADNVSAAMTQSMQAVAELPSWAEQIKRNPGNRDRILAQDREVFIETMQRWAASFFPSSDAPVPGVSAKALAALRLPVTVLRSGTTDMYHTRATSELLAQAIPGARLQEPPWGDDEWLANLARPDGCVFHNAAALAPQILELAEQVW